jgi:copper(I)-binding protein
MDRMKKWGRFLGLIMSASLLLAACAPAADSADCANLPAGGPTIKIDGAWSRAADVSMSSAMDTPTAGATAMSGGMNMGVSVSSAAYFVINNCGAEADTLLSVASDVAGSTGMHITQTINNVTSMTEVQKIEIPAGKKVEFKEGGYHVMLMNLKQSINPGDPVNLTLTFEKAGQIKVTAPARAP